MNFIPDRSLKFQCQKKKKLNEQNKQNPIF